MERGRRTGGSAGTGRGGASTEEKRRGDWLKRKLGKRKKKDYGESVCIDTTTPAMGRRRGSFDLEEAKKSNIAGPQSVLATARIISDIHRL